ncbi:pilus assembly protein [Streptomyces sp. SL13]|uniref:Pilus assembly protein n=1 Tax=Streptantibioticus silvisoli TaxID=2705255 RepID=A0AA90KGD6_9ACTN|nr:pilus assembly protein [Streptantibioticus silvisoli]MDI5963988.1 pilus assembly protein [Streptantibioticus silvisoli]MDI5970049.1 pilus assembly protein [Streptantibioticus silvisoli]
MTLTWRWRAAGPLPRPAGDRGQVSVELLGITPLILAVLVVVWQFVVIGYGFVLAGNAADQAARAAAVGHDAGAAARADLPSAAWVSGASVAVGTDGDVVTARVSLRVPLLVPGLLSLPFTVTGDGGAAKETP